MSSKQAPFGVGTAMLLLLVCDASTASEKDESPPALELLATSSQTLLDKPVQVVLVRRDAARHQPVRVFGPPGAKLSIGDANGCGTKSAGTASLQIDGTSADVINICVRLQPSNSTARLSAIAPVQGNVLTAISDVIEVRDPPQTNIFSTPLMAVALPAAIGFLFGLGSSFFQVWLEKWKNARLAASEAQKFIATTLFPEMLAHAKSLRAFLEAPNAKQLSLATRPLAIPKITEAIQGERVAHLVKYFKDLSPSTFIEQLRSYDTTLSQFNHEANALSHVEPRHRNLLSQQDYANRLRTHLSDWGLY